jgi:hypothetical protein
VLTFAAVTASAQGPSGTLNFAGTVRASAPDPINVFLDFLPSPGPANPINISVQGGNTGDFAVFNPSLPIPGVFGTIQDLLAAPGASVIPAFVTVPGFTFNLEFVAPGTNPLPPCFDAPAIGQSCTPPSTPFNLENISSGNAADPISSSVSFSVRGTVVGAGGVSAFFGSFTAQFPGVPYQELLAALVPGGSTVDVSFSATFVASNIPEPSTYLLMATGLLGLVGASRLRRRV